MTNWISVTDDLPLNEQLVLIFEKGSAVPITAKYLPREVTRCWSEICNCHCGDGYGSGFYQEEVTHWMPLPEPPK